MSGSNDGYQSSYKYVSRNVNREKSIFFRKKQLLNRVIVRGERKRAKIKECKSVVEVLNPLVFYDFCI